MMCIFVKTLKELAKCCCICTDKCRSWREQKEELKYARPNCLRIGYSLDGSFDENHIDFGVCFNCFHINKVDKIIGILTMILIIINLIVFSILKIGSFQIAVMIYSIFVVAVNVGIWRKNYHLVMSFIYSGIALSVIIIISLIIASVAVANLNSEFFDTVKSIFRTSNKIDVQLVIMLLILLGTFDLVSLLYITWLIYILGCYLKELNNEKYMEQMIEKGNIDELQMIIEKVNSETCAQRCFKPCIRFKEKYIVKSL